LSETKVSEVQSHQTVFKNPEEIPLDTVENTISQTNPEEIPLDNVFDELKDSEQKDSAVNTNNNNNNNNNVT
jgi:glutamate/tyrosine decarboxylase-like PLP-dependent enzyme